MTTKLILINTDTHVVVPREPTKEQVKAGLRFAPNQEKYKAMIATAPQLPTPPVLRWENGSLKIYDFEFANVSLDPRGWAYTFTGVNGVWFKNSEQEARRAAERALGIPFEVEEV